jgi:DNA repair exonuclease SbcCD ATPase subunit
MERWQKLAGVIPANSLRDFALQTMFDQLITIANLQLSGITSRYALRAVDLKDMVVIDLWNAGEQRPVETLIRWRVIPGQPVAGPGTSQN